MMFQCEKDFQNCLQAWSRKCLESVREIIVSCHQLTSALKRQHISAIVLTIMNARNHLNRTASRQQLFDDLMSGPKLDLTVNVSSKNDDQGALKPVPLPTRKLGSKSTSFRLLGLEDNVSDNKEDERIEANFGRRKLKRRSSMSHASAVGFKKEERPTLNRTSSRRSIHRSPSRQGILRRSQSCLQLRDAKAPSSSLASRGRHDRQKEDATPPDIAKSDSFSSLNSSASSLKDRKMSSRRRNKKDAKMRKGSSKRSGRSGGTSGAKNKSNSDSFSSLDTTLSLELAEKHHQTNKPAVVCLDRVSHPTNTIGMEDSLLSHQAYDISAHYHAALFQSNALENIELRRKTLKTMARSWGTVKVVQSHSDSTAFLQLEIPLVS